MKFINADGHAFLFFLIINFYRTNKLQHDHDRVLYSKNFFSNPETAVLLKANSISNKSYSVKALVMPACINPKKQII